jgi:hypothetical protein
MFLRLVAKMSDRSLEQWTNIKFWVKLGKNASDICTILSEAWGEKLWKSKVFLCGTNDSKRARTSKSQMKTMLITFFEIEGTEFIPQGQTVNQAYFVEILKRLLEDMHRRSELKPNDWILHSQLSRRSLSRSFWPKNPLLKWNTHLILLIWLRMTSGCFRNWSLPQRD